MYGPCLPESPTRSEFSTPATRPGFHSSLSGVTVTVPCGVCAALQWLAARTQTTAVAPTKLRFIVSSPSAKACACVCIATTWPNPGPPAVAGKHATRRTRYLLGSLENVLDLATGQRNRVAVFELVCSKRDNRPFVAANQIRERTGLDLKNDAFSRFVDRIRAEIADRTSDYGFAFLQCGLRGIIRRNLWQVWTREHDKEATAGVEDVVALWTGAKTVEFAAVLVRLLPRDKRPCPHELFLEGLLLRGRRSNKKVSAHQHPE